MTTSTPQPKTGPLSANDPNSFSNPEKIKAERIELKWSIDFQRNVITGTATYHLVSDSSEVDQIVFDVSELKIFKAQDVSNNKTLDFSLGTAIVDHGQPLSVKSPSLSKNAEVAGPAYRGKLIIEYETSSTAAGLQWLTKEQTLMKKQPYMFSQCESIFARSLVPCQDTPSSKITYSAEVTAITEVEVLMSAVKGTSSALNNGRTTHHFEQKIPIPSYLLAIAAGAIESRTIGPRSKVWAEKDLLDTAAFDFSDTEKMIAIGERLYGPYAWGVYDILVLPPSFPFGGMENPCLTFATPTLLTGDKSLSSVIAHEICHSWFGNLITNTTFVDFWLNEGFTVFAERRILGVLRGEKYRQFCLAGGLKELKEDVKSFGVDSPLTNLAPNLDLLSPEDTYSRIPYEKGCTFLYFLEECIGMELFEKFLRDYASSGPCSASTDTFREFLTSYLKKLDKQSLIADVDWNKWLHTPGMPCIIPKYDTSLSDVCVALKNRWIAWEVSTPCPFHADDLNGFIPEQKVLFLMELLDEEKLLGLDKVKAMQAAYNLDSNKNCDIFIPWLSLCLRNGRMESLPMALKFVTDNGRMRLIRPVYREMNKFPEMREKAIENFNKIRVNMMHASVQAVIKELKLES